jgi:tetratricopeptide (TPR) repeat protein
VKRRATHTSKSSAPHKLVKKKALKAKAQVAVPDLDAPAKQTQLKAYEEGLKYFQQQKFPKAKQALEKVLEGPVKELQDRAQMHIRICDQRASRSPVPTVKTAEDHYTQGVALMNLGRWDEAREHLDRAHKAAPKADHIVYAMAALDCLTGEADSAMKIATTHATTKTSLSCRKIRGLPNFFTRSATVRSADFHSYSTQRRSDAALASALVASRFAPSRAASS